MRYGVILAIVYYTAYYS